AGAQLSWLHARRARRTARRIGVLHQESAAARARERLISRQPRLGILQGRPARSRRRESQTRGRSDDGQFRHPGSLRPRAFQAPSACRAVTRLTAEIAASGSVGGRRLRARLLGGFTAPSVRLEAIAPAGPPFFIFVATGRDATLLLPRDERVLEHGEPAAVLE